MTARVWIAAAVLLLAGCGADPMPTAWLGEPVDAEATHSRIRYFDTDLISLNGACPVQGLPVNPIIEPLYVNGRPIGFC